jgi:hypothetical protein
MSSHRRKFRTLLWDGLRENWTGWKPGDDDPPTTTLTPPPADFQAAKERARTHPLNLDTIQQYPVALRMSEASAQIAKRYPMKSNDANWLVDREVDEDFERIRK